MRRMPKAGASARDNFERLPLAQRFAIVRSVARDRQAELVLAYKNVLRVAYGYKTTRGDARGRGSRVVAEPCVVFVVARKWGTPGRDNDPQKLPATLKATWVVRGKPIQCEVPTDVRARVFYGNLKPRASDAEAPLGLKVLRPGMRNVVGAPTCVVQRPARSELYLLCCRHVFSRTREDGDNVPPGLVVTTRQPGKPVVGKTAAIRGPLVQTPEASLDAQIALVESKAPLARVLDGLVFNLSPPWTRAAYDIGKGFYIATPRVDSNGDRIFVWVDFKDVGPMDISYDLGSGGSVMVRHDELIFGHSDDPLQDGDSGSPAVRVRTGDNRLVGMFIASQGNNVACIPAWDLLDPANYGLDEGMWRLR